MTVLSKESFSNAGRFCNVILVQLIKFFQIQQNIFIYMVFDVIVTSLRAYVFACQDVILGAKS